MPCCPFAVVRWCCCCCWGGAMAGAVGGWRLARDGRRWLHCTLWGLRRRRICSVGLEAIAGGEERGGRRGEGGSFRSRGIQSENILSAAAQPRGVALIGPGWLAGWVQTPTEAFELRSVLAPSLFLFYFTFPRRRHRLGFHFWALDGDGASGRLSVHPQRQTSSALHTCCRFWTNAAEPDDRCQNADPPQCGSAAHLQRARIQIRAGRRARILTAVHGYLIDTQRAATGNPARAAGTGAGGRGGGG